MKNLDTFNTDQLNLNNKADTWLIDVHAPKNNLLEEKNYLDKPPFLQEQGHHLRHVVHENEPLLKYMKLPTRGIKI